MKKIIVFLLTLVLLTSCSDNSTYFAEKIVKLNLSGALQERELEASGLSWYKDKLIILPQFPHKWEYQFDGALFYIHQKRIKNYLNRVDTTALEGEKLHFIAKGLDDIGKAYGSGYEAITFIDDTVFVSIESINRSKSTDYVVRGIIDFENKKVILDATTKHEVKSQTDIHNMGEETIFVYKNRI